MSYRRPVRGFALRGFTLVEMLVVIAIIGILAAMALPNFTKARNKAKETEVRSGTEVIHSAIERYHVDNQQYPMYVAGGSEASWSTWARHETGQLWGPVDLASLSNSTARYLKDPLVANGYVDAYPRNPFVDNGASVVTQTGGNATDPGSGDPRFGSEGDQMGNLMDDSHFLTALTTPNQPLFQFAHSRRGLVQDFTTQLYPTGGKLNPNNLDPQGNPIKVQNWWPGNFFYRVVGPSDMSGNHPNLDAESPREPWAYYIRAYDSFILGAYGSKTTDGLDVVRTGLANNIRFYTKPPAPPGAAFNDVALDNGTNGSVSSGLPEVMGGGDINTNPYFPPVKVQMNASGALEIVDGYTFGAPDGIPDGIVHLMTPDGVSGNDY